MRFVLLIVLAFCVVFFVLFVFVQCSVSHASRISELSILDCRIIFQSRLFY